LRLHHRQNPNCVNKPFVQRCHDLETVIEEFPAKVSSRCLFRKSLPTILQGNLLFPYY
uniref:Uncharacterized protein n=1 Tax=Bubo bubo TaxID=30461 RepID=A0A8C0ELQ8_BUBBB